MKQHNSLLQILACRCNLKSPRNQLCTPTGSMKVAHRATPFSLPKQGVFAVATRYSFVGAHPVHHDFVPLYSRPSRVTHDLPLSQAKLLLLPRRGSAAACCSHIVVVVVVVPWSFLVSYQSLVSCCSGILRRCPAPWSSAPLPPRLCLISHRDQRATRSSAAPPTRRATCRPAAARTRPEVGHPIRRCVVTPRTRLCAHMCPQPLPPELANRHQSPSQAVHLHVLGR